MELAKAQESLLAAQLSLRERLPNSAASRAYYGMFQAAQVALEHSGVRRETWSHPALQAAFATELVRRRKRYPAVFPSRLHEAAEVRLIADYATGSVGHRQATRLVRWAEEFLAAAEKHLS